MWHLLVKRRRISPIAIGLTPPLDFGTATSAAPARTGATSAQARPCDNSPTTAASWSSIPRAAPGGPWTRRPLGPGVVSAGKLRSAWVTVFGHTFEGSGKSWMSLSGAGCAGCNLARQDRAPSNQHFGGGGVVLEVSVLGRVDPPGP